MVHQDICFTQLNNQRRRPPGTIAGPRPLPRSLQMPVRQHQYQSPALKRQAWNCCTSNTEGKLHNIHFNQKPSVTTNEHGWIGSHYLSPATIITNAFANGFTPGCTEVHRCHSRTLQGKAFTAALHARLWKGQPSYSMIGSYRWFMLETCHASIFS